MRKMAWGVRKRRENMYSKPWNNSSETTKAMAEKHGISRWARDNMKDRDIASDAASK